MERKLVLLVAFLSPLKGYALGRMNLPNSELIILVFITCNCISGFGMYISLRKMLASVNFLTSHAPFILSNTAWQLPFSMYIFKKDFATMPTDIIESARIDGSPEFTIIYKIVLSLIVPAIATGIVFSCIGN